MFTLAHFRRIALTPAEGRAARARARELASRHGPEARAALAAAVRADLTAYGTLNLSLDASGRAALAKRLRAASEQAAYLAPLPTGGFVADLVTLAHAPAGGVTVGGTHYAGGRFIPAAVMAEATPAEQAAVEGGSKPQDGDGDAPDAQALRWHLMAALIEVAAEAKEAGDDAKAQAVLDELADLGSDAGVEELRAALANTQNLALGVEWEAWLGWAKTGSTDRRGRPRWYNAETKEARYQHSEPGSRQRRRSEADVAHKHLHRIRDYEDVTADHLDELAEKLPHLTVDQLRKVRGWMGARRVGGGRLKQSLVDAVKAYARRMVEQQGANAAKYDAEQQAAQNPPEDKPAPTPETPAEPEAKAPPAAAAQPAGPDKPAAVFDAYERASKLSEAELAQAQALVAGMTKPELDAAADKMGQPGAAEMSRPALVKLLSQRIADRRGTWLRSQIGDRKPKPAAQAASPADVGRSVAEAHDELAGANARVGGFVKVHELVDRLRGRHPGLTKEQAHEHLKRLRAEGALVLQESNDPRHEPGEGVDAGDGRRWFNVVVRDDSPLRRLTAAGRPPP